MLFDFYFIIPKITHFISKKHIYNDYKNKKGKDLFSFPFKSFYSTTLFSTAFSNAVSTIFSEETCSDKLPLLNSVTI